MRFIELGAALMVATCGIALALPAQAQDYPSKPITLLIGFPPGGPIDIAARRVQPYLSKYLNQRVIVVSKVGASGALMHVELANATPDGYTLGLMSSPGLFTIVFGSNLTYTADSFDYIGTMTHEPYAIFVHRDSAYKDLKSMVDRLQVNPRSINMSATGIGTAAHLTVLLLERAAGVKFNYIPAEGAAAMTASVLGKHVDAGVITVSAAFPLLAEGTIAIPGVLARERMAVAPQIPTYYEQGAKVEWSSVRGIGGPKGLPADVKKKIYDAMQKMHADPEFIAQAEKDKQFLFNISSERYTADISEQYRLLSDLWKESPWR